MKKIPLTQGKFAIVDDEDFHYLNRFMWFSANSEGYFVARRKIRTVNQVGASVGNVYIDLSGMVFPPKLYSVVAHKNKDTLDYRKENLFYESYSVKRHRADKQKGKTSSRYKGVSFKKVGHPVGRQWSACVYKLYDSRIAFYLGCFATQEEAAVAYDAKARELYGEHAYQNFPQA